MGLPWVCTYLFILGNLLILSPPGLQFYLLQSPGWFFWKWHQWFPDSPQLVWVVRSVFCHCLHDCFMSISVSWFAFWLSPFSLGFPTDKVPDQMSRLPPWNKHSDTLTGPHQLVWLISFGSHHCLPYHLFISFVPFYVIVYGFLLFQLSLHIGKVLDQIPSKHQTLSCTQPCTHPSILWKGTKGFCLPQVGWFCWPTHLFVPTFFVGEIIVSFIPVVTINGTVLMEKEPSSFFFQWAQNYWEYSTKPEKQSIYLTFSRLQDLTGLKNLNEIKFEAVLI